MVKAGPPRDAEPPRTIITLGPQPLPATSQDMRFFFYLLIFLLFSFALTFYVLLSNPNGSGAASAGADPSSPTTPFASFGNALLQLFTTMLGDVQFTTYSPILGLGTAPAVLAVTLACESGLCSRVPTRWFPAPAVTLAISAIPAASSSCGIPGASSTHAPGHPSRRRSLALSLCAPMRPLPAVAQQQLLGYCWSTVG
jgi:hypothetical protein